MAAQVMANELGFDLLRVDLSAVMSKWVGETAQNLQKILSSKRSRQRFCFLTKQIRYSENELMKSKARMIVM